jgi:hypothetical protein
MEKFGNNDNSILINLNKKDFNKVVIEISDTENKQTYLLTENDFDKFIEELKSLREKIKQENKQ